VLGPQIPGAQREKVHRGLIAPTIEPVAEAVWLVRGDFPRTMNVYLLEDDGGVTAFDAGTHAMTDGIGEAAERFGGLKRIMLGHAHSDHRGAAAGLGAPVYCHPDEVPYAEAEHGDNEPYFRFEDLDRFKPAGRAT
jgi:hydroxyacylglutathione hydrolase